MAFRAIRKFHFDGTSAALLNLKSRRRDAVLSCG